jgi:hypothetical protein
LRYDVFTHVDFFEVFKPIKHMLIRLPQNGPVRSYVVLPFWELDAMIDNNADNPCFIHTSGHFILHMDHY